MERLITSAEKKKLQVCLREFNLFSRIALYLLAPTWLATAAWVAYDIFSLSNSADGPKAGLSEWSVNRIELLAGFTILSVIALRENRGERWEIGRVRETNGVFARASADDGKGYRLDNKPLFIPYTMDIDCAQFEGKTVLVERADVLRTQRGKGKWTEQWVVAIRLTDFISARS